MDPATPAWPARDARHLLVTAAEMASLEEQLFASGLPVEALMEKAALAVAGRIQRQWAARLAAHGALVLVGPGHNGGDGLVIARELHLAGVAVRLWCPFERSRPLTASHLRHALWLGIRRLEASPDPADAALWIDALFGIGQSRSPGPALEALLAERQRRCPGALVAVDAPTGLCCDSGRLLGAVAARAVTTYCIGLLKTGLIQDGALAWTGAVEPVALGLPATLLGSLPRAQPLGLDPADLPDLPPPPLDPAADKYARGRLLVVAGSDRYRGACALALLGADASGCGSLAAAVPTALAASLWRWLPHLVVRTGLGCHPDGSLDLGGLAGIDLERLDAVLVGPGIGAPSGSPPDAERLAWQRLQRFAGLLVLDADGLNRLNADWLTGRAGSTWITPHRAEFQRLFPDLAVLPPLEAAAAAARRTGAGVLLKGARSAIAAPDGRRWQLLRAAATAARTGLGDVLAGHAAGRGAMALAAGLPADPVWLAASALAHAAAGLDLEARAVVPNPERVARRLAGLD